MKKLALILFAIAAIAFGLALATPALKHGPQGHGGYPEDVTIYYEDISVFPPIELSTVISVDGVAAGADLDNMKNTGNGQLFTPWPRQFTLQSTSFRNRYWMSQADAEATGAALYHVWTGP